MSGASYVIMPGLVSAAASGHKRGMADIAVLAKDGVSAIEQFVGDTTLSGNGYDSIKGKLEQYLLIFSTLGFAMEFASGDNTTLGSEVESRFAGHGVVNQAEFESKRDEAYLNMWRLQQEINNSSSSDLLSPISNAWRHSMIDSYSVMAGYAEGILSQIDSYIAATSGLFALSKDLGTALLAYAGNLADASYDMQSGTWPAVCQEGFEALKEAALRAARANLPLDDEGNPRWDLYEGGELNTEQCRILMLLPFDFWEQLEKDAMTGAYNAMWDDRNLVAIEQFLQCAYTDGDEEEFSYSNVMPGPTSAAFDVPPAEASGSRYEKLLTGTFKDFALYYAQQCELGGYGSDYEQLRLRATFLLDVATTMSTVWVADKDQAPDFEITCVTEGDIGNGGNDLLFVGISTDSLEDDYPHTDKKLWSLSSSGSYIKAMDFLLENILSEQMTDPGQAFLISIGESIAYELISLALSAPHAVIAGTVFTIGSIGVDAAQAYNEAHQRNDALTQAIEINRFQTMMISSHMEATVSLNNGELSVRMIGYDDEKLIESVAAYNAEERAKDKSFVDITPEDVKEAIDEYARTRTKPTDNTAGFFGHNS